MKQLILCADDYALSLEMDEGIRRLVSAGRLSAVSCMADSPLWPQEAEALKPLQGRMAVGLHFNLTTAFSQPRPPLWQLIRDSLSGRIDSVWIERELHQQLDCFEYAWDNRPDFFDGHQHVHIFPGIRQVVMRVLVDRYSPVERPWVRRVNPSFVGHDALLKAVILRLLNAGFAAAACRAGLSLSGDFSGLYSLSSKADFPGLMAKWLQVASQGGLIMCHPGLESDLDVDGLAQTRLNEWRYLIGAEFAELCREQGIRLAQYDEPEKYADTRTIPDN